MSGGELIERTRAMEGFKDRLVAISEGREDWPEWVKGAGEGKRKPFLLAYSMLGTVTHAADAVGMDSKTHQNWKNQTGKDGELTGAAKAYREAFDVAQEHASDILELEARRRAVEGVTDAVYYMGEVVGEKRTYSDQLLMFMLKALRPEKFREKVQADVTATLKLEDLVSASMKDAQFQVIESPRIEESHGQETDRQ
jgi:hypothetical protein